MISVSLISLFIVIASIVWWVTRDKTEEKGLKIPGPRGIPGFGNAIQIGRQQHVKFAEWSKKYGAIYKIRLGNKLTIVISDPKMIKEVFTVEPAFAGRKFFEGFEMYPYDPMGIILSQGELWEVHRRFLLRQLRDFGFGKSSMEQLIIGEVNETISRLSMLQEKNGRITDTKQVLLIAVVNALFTILASTRYDHDDQEMIKRLQLSDEMTNKVTESAIFFLVPWTRYFLPEVKGFDELRMKNRNFYISLVEEHKKTFQEDNIRDFIDVYLSEMEVQKGNPQSQFYGERAERNLHNILGDLEFAGTDTTSTTLNWSVLYLAKFQNVQKKLQKEIEEVTGGNSRQVSVKDRPSMPYAQATLDEIMRKSSIVPNGVQHNSTAGRYFRGYWVPKDTWIFPDLYFLHNNPKIWGDPENFRPERFLSEDGLKYQKNENLMPFQIGRRQCLGEGMARDTMFLFLTNIFQKFSIKLDPSKPEPSLEPVPSFILCPTQFSVILEERV